MRQFPWWAWISGTVFALATAAAVFFVLHWDTGRANELAGVASFVLAAVSLVATLVQPFPQRNAQKLSRELAAHVMYVSGKRPPRVSELSDRQLGVRPAVGSAEFGETRYVKRDVESTAIQAMNDGQMVVLVGSATAGKTRTAAHLVRKLFPKRFLYAPTGVGSLSALLDAGHRFRNAVVWLDDVEQHFGEDGIDLGVLSRLCRSGRDDVVIVATLRHKEFLKFGLTAEATRLDETKPNPAGSAVLAHLLKQNRLFQVAADLSQSELIAVKAAQAIASAGDVRLLTASQSGRGFGEYLGAGVEMINRWTSCSTSLEKVGSAIISGAVDARRAGYSGPIPDSVLAELVKCFLPEPLQTRADTPSVTHGLKWAVQPVSGTETSSCLVPHPDSGFSADDYLVDQADSSLSPLTGTPVQDCVWRAVLNLADPDQSAAVGMAAYSAGNLNVAEIAWRQSTKTRRASAMAKLGIVLRMQDKTVEAETWFRRAAEADYSHAMMLLGYLMDEQGNFTEAETWYRKAATAGHTVSMVSLGRLLLNQARLSEAESWFRKAAQVEDTAAMNNLGVVLAMRGNLTDAGIWFHKAADNGMPEAMYGLSKVLATQGNLNGAETWLRRAIDAGHSGADDVLAALLELRVDKGSTGDSNAN